MREIIHLQLGEISSYVGCHLWNTISSYFEQAGGDATYNSQVSFRTGEYKGQPTYTPRLVSIDLKGARGGLSLQGELYADDQGTDKSLEKKAWDGKLTRVDSGLIPKNKFLESLDDPSGQSHSEMLTKTVKNWSDFNSIYYHPKTLVETRDYVYRDETNQFRFFNQGQETMQDSEFEIDVMDERIRKFMEECDSAQGFQILTNADDAFSGMTASIVQEFTQEYPKKSILVFGLSESSLQTSRVAKANQALLIKSLQDSQVHYIPLYAPSTADLDTNTWSMNLDPKFDTLYQRSAYVAAAIESLTLPLRLNSCAQHKELNQLQTMMDYNSSSTNALVFGFPGYSDMHSCQQVVPTLPDGSWNWARDLTCESIGNIKGAHRSWSVFRGIKSVLSHQTLAPNQIHLNDVEIQDGVFSTLSKLSSTATGSILDYSFPITPGFPQFFSDRVTEQGLVSTSTTSPQSKKDVSNVAAVAALHNGPHLSKLYKRMLANVTFKPGQKDGVLMNDFSQGQFGMDVIEWYEIKEHFEQLASIDDGNEL